MSYMKSENYMECFNVVILALKYNLLEEYRIYKFINIDENA